MGKESSELGQCSVFGRVGTVRGWSTIERDWHRAGDASSSAGLSGGDGGAGDNKITHVRIEKPHRTG